MENNDRTPPPLRLRDIERVVRARPPRVEAAITRRHRFFVRAGEKPPELRTELRPVSCTGDGRGGQTWEIAIELQHALAERATPPPLRGEALRRTERKLDPRELDRMLTGFLPEHLALSPLPTRYQRAHRTIQAEAGRERRVATTVFSPDDRRIFRDTHYPWCTVGRVETNRGGASGVMIGPRHMLTCSHIIDWTAPPGFAADWVRFIPAAFDGDQPFGDAYGVHVYWFVQEDGDGFITGNEGDYDFAVVVLGERLGETTGWMGARGYDDAWDNLDAWSHIGYPGDLNSGQRPSFQGGFRMDGTDAGGQSLLHLADVFPGQSGGPLFGWWDGDVGPRAVAVQSWQTSSTNGASGGMDLRDLVARARSEFP